MYTDTCMYLVARIGLLRAMQCTSALLKATFRLFNASQAASNVIASNSGASDICIFALIEYSHICICMCMCICATYKYNLASKKDQPRLKLKIR